MGTDGRPYEPRLRPTPKLLAALPDKGRTGGQASPVASVLGTAMYVARPYQNFGISVKKVTDFIKGWG